MFRTRHGICILAYVSVPGEDTMRWCKNATAAAALGAVVLSGVWCESALAGAAPPVTFTVDENCFGTFSIPNPTNPTLPPLQTGRVPCSVGQDTTPGGASNAVIYDLFA